MSTGIRLVAALVGALVLTACGDATPSPSPTGAPDTPSPAATTPAATHSPGPTAGPTTRPTTAPTGDAGADFTCDLPIVAAGSAPIANIVDVRVGTHDGYDRLVIEFEQGSPDVTLDRASPPFTEDGSGLPVEVEGESFVGLVMRHGTKQTDTGTSSYDGRTEFATGFAMLVHAVEAGDFERQSTWILGLAAEACVRVLLLDDPPRLAIDVEH